MIRKASILLIILMITGSCGNTKYTYNFERGRMIDFSQGKWILNRPVTNYNQQRIYNIALREFKRILGDSLYEISDLPPDRIMGNRIPFEPSKEELKALETGIEFDYLINVSSNIVKSEMNSLASGPAMGMTTRTNQAGTRIRICDLKTLSLISDSGVTGVAKLTQDADDGIQYVNNAATISMQGLNKLIRQYRKNRKRN